METIAAEHAAKRFGSLARHALREPVAVTHHGEPSVVLLSHAEYQRLKRRDREALRIEQLTDADRALIAAARAPADAAAFDHEVED